MKIIEIKVLKGPKKECTSLKLIQMKLGLDEMDTGRESCITKLYPHPVILYPGEIIFETFM